MHVDRLTKLADFLDTLPPEKFDIGEWRSPCGTVCCAWGWCPTIFPEVETSLGSIMYKGNIGYAAAAIFFELEVDVALDLFSYRNYPPPVLPTDVAKNIRRLCDTHTNH